MTVRVRGVASLGVATKGRGPPRVAIIVDWVFVTSREFPISRYQQGFGREESFEERGSQMGRRNLTSSLPYFWKLNCIDFMTIFVPTFSR